MTLREYIRKLIEEELEFDDDLDEATGTGSVAGYNVPSAFKKSNGTNPNDEPDDYHTKTINQSTGYKKIQEVKVRELKNMDGSPRTKISKGITKIKHNVSEIEQMITWYAKVKEENSVKREDYWKKTEGDLRKIRERLRKVAVKLEQL